MQNYSDIYQKLLYSPEANYMANTCIPNGMTLLNISQQIYTSAQGSAINMDMSPKDTDLLQVLSLLEAYTYVPYGKTGETIIAGELKGGVDLKTTRYNKMISMLKRNKIDVTPELDSEIKTLLDSREKDITPITPACLVSAMSKYASRIDELGLDPALSTEAIEEMASDCLFKFEADITPKKTYLKTDKLMKGLKTKSKHITPPDHVIDFLKSLDLVTNHIKEM